MREPGRTGPRRTERAGAARLYVAPFRPFPNENVICRSVGPMARNCRYRAVWIRYGSDMDSVWQRVGFGLPAGGFQPRSSFGSHGRTSARHERCALRLPTDDRITIYARCTPGGATSRESRGTGPRYHETAMIGPSSSDRKSKAAPYWEGAGQWQLIKMLILWGSKPANLPWDAGSLSLRNIITLAGRSGAVRDQAPPPCLHKILRWVRPERTIARSLPSDEASGA